MDGPRREQTGPNEVRVVFTIKRGRQARVGLIEPVAGLTSIPQDELAPLIVLKKGDLFIESRLNATRTAIRERLRQKGFAGADVKAEVFDVPRPEGGPPDVDLVGITLLVQEGAQTVIGKVQFVGNDRVRPPSCSRSSAFSRASRSTRRAWPTTATSCTSTISTRAIRTPRSKSDRVQPGSIGVDVTFQIREGPLVLVDHVIIVGNTRTSTATVERELMVKTGDVLSQSKVFESQRRLTALGLFRRVRITELTHAEPGKRDLLVSVEEAPATTIGYGAGRGGQHAGAPGGRRAGGRAPGVRAARVLRGRTPEPVGQEPQHRPLHALQRAAAQHRRRQLRAERVSRRVSYREPRAFGWNADAFVTGVLERAIRSSFSYDRRALQAQLVHRLGPRLSVSGHYSFERTKLFDEQIAPEDELIVDRLYPRVRLSSFSTAILRDTRDEPLDPEAGTLLGFDTEYAARAIGSQVGFSKVFGQAFWFRRLPGSRRIVFATGARVGLGRGFPQDVQRLGPDRRSNGQAVDEIEEIPASERFFAGGDNTVRGFALDRLGDEATLDANGVPTGGNAVFVFNGELRIHVWRDFGAVGFLDVGNVFARVSDIDFGSLRGAVGFGVRYQSPFGPLRADVGFKLDQQTFANGSRERLTGFHISIGHAF